MTGILSPQTMAFLERYKEAKDMEGMNKYLNPEYAPIGKYGTFLSGERFSGEPRKFMSPLEKVYAKLEQDKIAQDEQNARYGKATKALGIAGDVGKGAIGLGQIFKSLNVKKNLREPKAPQAPLESHLLNTQIAKALRSADSVDPRYNTQAQRDAAVNYARDDARARNYSAGNGALFQALSQLNAIKANDSLRKSNLSAEQLKDSRNARADHLIGRKLYEDMAKYDRARKDYKEIDLPEFLSRRAYGGKLSSKGLENLFQLLDGFVPKQTS